MARFNCLFNNIYQPLLDFEHYNADGSSYSALLKCRSLTDKYMKLLYENSHDRKSVSLSCVDALEFYELAVNQSEETQNMQLRAEICHEYADLLFNYGEIEAAELFWDRCISTVFSTKSAYWRMSLNKKPDRVISCRCFLLAGIAAAKLAIHIHFSDSSRHDDLISLASYSIGNCLQFSISHPTEHLAYVSYTPSMIAPNLDLFVDSRACNPEAVHSFVEILIRRLVDSRKSLDALPLAAFNLFLASNILESDRLFAESVLSKVKIFVHLGLLSEAIDRLLLLAKGLFILPKNQTCLGAQLSSAASFGGFYEKNSLLESKNWACFTELAEIEMSPRLKIIYGEEIYYQFNISRCNVIQKILRLYFANDEMSSRGNDETKQDFLITSHYSGSDVLLPVISLRRRQLWFSSALQQRSLPSNAKHVGSSELDSSKNAAPPVRPLSIGQISNSTLELALQLYSLFKDRLMNVNGKNLASVLEHFVDISILSAECYVMNNLFLLAFNM